ncbi:FbpB family small basic protein [Bacillus marinisedimentorum]|nr:FbpB family small basic protein [Bacillus marinisedimentorum]
MAMGKTLEQLIEENKQELLKDEKAIERIEKRIEEKYEMGSKHNQH